MPIFYTDKWGIEYEIRFSESNHARPHVHIHYKNNTGSIAIDNLEVLAGKDNLSYKTLKRAKEYIENNKDELLHKWTDAKNGINFVKN